MKRPHVDAARAATLTALLALEEGASWERSWRLSRRNRLQPLDRRLAHELVCGCVRMQGRLDWILRQHSSRKLERLDPVVRVLLRLGLYQLLEADRIAPHSAVHTTVELTKSLQPYAVAFVNAVLRSAQRRVAEFPDPKTDPLGYLVAFHSHPAWILRRWLERFGFEETVALCDANNRRPEVCLRVNPLRATRSTLLATTPGSSAGVWSQASIRCGSRFSSVVRDIVDTGQASVQDESAMLVAPLLALRTGGRVLDLAAAPGGKCCHAAELLHGEGRVVAVDRTWPKIERLRENLQRLGLANVQVVVGDGRSLRPGSFDAVLLDAPCSGLGVLARRPDLRWRKRSEDLERLGKLQLEFLEAAARHVVRGGRLVYSVCSFEPEETLEVAARFSTRHPEMQPVDPDVDPALRPAPGILYSLPQRHGMDGSFAACWQRTR